MSRLFRVKATPTTFRGEKCIELTVSAARSRLFVPLDQLREVADILHDHADIYEEAQRDGRISSR